MTTYFEPDKSDTRYKDDFDKRCIHCGNPGMDHYNGQCREDEDDRPDDEDYADVAHENTPGPYDHLHNKD